MWCCRRRSRGGSANHAGSQRPLEGPAPGSLRKPLPSASGRGARPAAPLRQVHCKASAARLASREASEVLCCSLGGLCKRLCDGSQTTRRGQLPVRQERGPLHHPRASDEGEPPPRERGVTHFGRASEHFFDLSCQLPPLDLRAFSAGLDALEAALADVLEQPAGKATCEAYGGRRCCLMRFLQARESDVKRAAEMFRVTAKWRHENTVNSFSSLVRSDLRSQLMARMRAYWPGYCVGLTKDGSPLLYTNVSLVTSALYEFDEEALRLLYMGWMEQSLQLQNFGLQRACLAAGGPPGSTGPGRPELPLPQNIEVFDFGGMSALQLTARAIMLARSAAFLSIGVAHYPEHLRKCYIVNTPTVFNLVTNLILKTLPPATRCKIEVVSDARSLLEVMEPEQVQAMLSFSIRPSGDHAKALNDVRCMMSSWKAQQGLKVFAEL